MDALFLVRLILGLKYMFGLLRKDKFLNDCARAIEVSTAQQTQVSKSECIAFVNDYITLFRALETKGFDAIAASEVVVENVLLALANGTAHRLRESNDCQCAEMICIAFSHQYLEMEQSKPAAIKNALKILQKRNKLII